MDSDQPTIEKVDEEEDGEDEEEEKEKYANIGRPNSNSGMR